MSYNGGINFGLLADYDSMDDVDVIASGIETAIAELVRKAMGDRTEITTAASRVSVYEQAGPSKWDEKRMVADGIDPAQYKVAGKPSSRIKITPQGEQ